MPKAHFRTPKAEYVSDYVCRSCGASDLHAFVVVSFRWGGKRESGCGVDSQAVITTEYTPNYPTHSLSSCHCTLYLEPSTTKYQIYSSYPHPSNNHPLPLVPFPSPSPHSLPQNPSHLTSHISHPTTPSPISSLPSIPSIRLVGELTSYKTQSAPIPPDLPLISPIDLAAATISLTSPCLRVREYPHRHGGIAVMSQQ